MYHKNSKMNLYYLLCVFCAVILCRINAIPDEGKWDTIFTMQSETLSLSKTLYKGAKFSIHINTHCVTDSPDASVGHMYLGIFQLQCFLLNETLIDTLKSDITSTIELGMDIDEARTVYYNTITYNCSDHIFFKNAENSHDKHNMPQASHNVFTAPVDGIYHLLLRADRNHATISEYSINVLAEMKSDYGYLSFVDWPLLPFYGFMCMFYVILGLIWLILCFLQWRDLLRVQFWIGAVILLGMLEKAAFYAEYQNINSTGTRVPGATVFAEWVSCVKRTLTRMLVIIVSLGFGIVKPRLGATLHRVVGVGLLYFFLAASEGYLRVHPVNSKYYRDVLVASIPLAVLDSAICWWIFSALVNTTRTLRLRRNETKLTLYRHFTNALIFSVVASIFFMLYGIKAHRMAKCLTEWKDIWVENAYWHIQFSCLLLFIMILWRPNNNNQRYAFVPLLDTGDDPEEEEQLVNDAYGVKVRIHHSKQTPSPRVSLDDDLKWLEENVKSDPALPILDSDEELVNTRFEVSKMQ